MTVSKTITVEKLEAARRQLHTAIRLWFDDGDPVSIHALLSAAHEIIHTRFRLKGLKGLLFDSPHIPDSERSNFGKVVTKAAVFFKHARSDPYAELHFRSEANEFLMSVCVQGVWRMGEEIAMEEAIVALWLGVHRPAWSPGGLADSPAEYLDELRKLSKGHFFHHFVDLWLTGELRGAVADIQRRMLSRLS